jgi:hypothetical protein
MVTRTCLRNRLRRGVPTCTCVTLPTDTIPAVDTLDLRNARHLGSYPRSGDPVTEPPCGGGVVSRAAGGGPAPDTVSEPRGATWVVRWDERLATVDFDVPCIPDGSLSAGSSVQRGDIRPPSGAFSAPSYSPRRRRHPCPVSGCHLLETAHGFRGGCIPYRPAAASQPSHHHVAPSRQIGAVLETGLSASGARHCATSPRSPRRGPLPSRAPPAGATSGPRSGWAWMTPPPRDRAPRRGTSCRLRRRRPPA